MKYSAWATAALAVSASVVIAACGSSTSSAPSGSGSSSPAAGAGSGAAAAGKTLGCMVTDTGGIDDKSFNASAWAGMQAAAKASRATITVKYLQSTTQADYVPNINTFISQKCDVIVTVGVPDGRRDAGRGQGPPEARSSRSWTAQLHRSR